MQKSPNRTPINWKISTWYVTLITIFPPIITFPLFSKESEKNDDEKIEVINTLTQQKEEEPYSNELFDLIHSRQLVPYLPSRSWAIHCTDEPEKSIVISEITVRLENGIGLVPLYTKQV